MPMVGSINIEFFLLILCVSWLVHSCLCSDPRGGQENADGVGHVQHILNRWAMASNG